MEQPAGNHDVRLAVSDEHGASPTPGCWRVAVSVSMTLRSGQNGQMSGRHVGFCWSSCSGFIIAKAVTVQAAQSIADFDCSSLEIAKNASLFTPLCRQIDAHASSVCRLGCRFRFNAGLTAGLWRS